MKKKKLNGMITVLVCMMFCAGSILGTILNPGEVVLDKKAEWVDKENGIAKVSLSVESEPIVRPADVVLLVDRSNSMTFSSPYDISGQNGIYSKCMNQTHWKDGKHYYNPNEAGALTIQNLYQKEKGCTDRFDVTIDAVNEFLDTFFAYSNENRVAFVSFCENTNAKYNLDFTNQKELISCEEEGQKGIIQKAQEHIDGGTNYTAGLQAVKGYIQRRNEKESGDKTKNSRPTYVIFLTDGKPTNGNNGIAVANELKDMGVIVYSVGIGELQNDYLGQIATPSQTQEYYRSVNSASELNGFYEKVATRIYNAGTDAVITDVIGKDFDYYEDEEHMPNIVPTLKPYDSEDGKTIEWKQKEIVKEKQTYEFYIKLKEGENYKNGTWNTNQSATLVFKNINGEEEMKTAPVPSLTRHKYRIEHYLEKEDGTFSETPIEVEEISAEEGEYVQANAKKYEKYIHNPSVTGTILNGNIEKEGTLVLKLYYEKVKSSVIVKYVDTEGKEIAQSDIKKGAIGTPYQTERKSIYGYQAYGDDPKNQSGFYADENQEVVYVYEKKKSTVTIQYVDVEGNKIAEDLVMNGNVGENYQTERIDIENYHSYGEEPENQSGKFEEKDAIVIYQYEKDKGSIRIEYIDQNGNKILEDKVVFADVGNSYIVKRKEILGYRAYGNDPQNQTGKIVNGEILITYQYEKIKGNVIISYVDTEGNKIAEDDILSGPIGEKYETKRKDILGYFALEKDPEHKTGTFENKDITVTYVYQKMRAVDTSDINVILYVVVALVALSGIAYSIYLIGHKKKDVSNEK